MRLMSIMICEKHKKEVDYLTDSGLCLDCEHEEFVKTRGKM